MSKQAEEIPELVVADAAAWQEWLGKHHGDASGVWLVLSKKGTVTPTSLTYDQALEGALSHGWIDGQALSRDESTYRQRFTPRRSRSRWSKRNTGIAERLMDEGRMHAAGLAEVELAKSDGRWAAAYEGARAIQVPYDLVAALKANPAAEEMFATLSATNRYAILYRVHDAKRPETRARRIEQFVAMLARGETIYGQRQVLDRKQASSPRTAGGGHSVRTRRTTPP